MHPCAYPFHSFCLHHLLHPTSTFAMLHLAWHADNATKAHLTIIAALYAIGNTKSPWKIVASNSFCRYSWSPLHFAFDLFIPIVTYLICLTFFSF